VPYKYLYIDDEAEDKVIPYAEGLSTTEFQVIPIQVEKLNKAFILSNLSEYDGILMDLRTDMVPSKNGTTSDFTGAVWGQHIRDLVTIGNLKKDIPIILFSHEAKLRDVYFRDMTSNNIFDRFLTKNIIDNGDNEQVIGKVIQKLISLSKGYQEISTEKDFNKLLQIDTVNLDSRIFSRFIQTDGSSNLNIPTHEYAQMILKDLIYAKGVLINEKYLASRLGIDKENSKDWKKIKEKFKEAKYNGVFSDGWDRWWMFKVDDIFEEISDTYLSYLDAKEKVTILKEKLELESLVFPLPIESKDGSVKNHSYRYWTVCKALKRPMDASEGFRVYTRQEPKPWQEYEYVSLQALLDEESLLEKDIKIHLFDKEKYFLARSKV